MRSSIIPFVAVGVLVSTAIAQEQVPEKVNQALQQRYGKDVQVRFVGAPTELNGVQIHKARIRSKLGESDAMVTEHGDFLLSGLPSQFKTLPRDVQGTRTLFRSDPKNAESFIADGYYIDVDQGGKIYRLRFDPVGRLRSIANPEDVERSELTNLQKADQSIAGRIQELAEKHVPEGTKIREIYTSPMRGFFVTQYESPSGERIIVLDEQGNIYQTRTEIPRDQLPHPVRQAFEGMFDADKLRKAYRTQFQFYQFDQQASGGDRITFKVRPNGDVMEVQSTRADEDDQAVTARFREGQRPDERDDRDRR